MLKAHPSIVRNDCLTPIMIPTTQVRSTDDLAWPHGGCRPSLVHIQVMGAALMQTALPLACLVHAFQQSHLQAIACTH